MNLSFTQEDLKNRLLQHAAYFWGIDNSDMLDPVVRLMMEALGNELANLNHIQADAQAHVVERLADLMVPPLLSSAQPSYCIAKAQPTEAYCHLNYDSMYIYKQKNESSNPQSDSANYRHITFTPLFPCKLLKINTKAIIYPNGINYILNQQHRTQFFPLANLAPHTTWIALTIASGVENLNGLSIWFDWPILDNKNSLNHSLHATKWFVNDQPIKLKFGLSRSKKQAQLIEDIITEDPVNSLIENDIASFYENSFATIACDIFTKDHLCSGLPDELKNNFNSSLNEDLKNQELIWVKLIFPANFSTEDLSKMRIHLNAFPLVNKYKKSIIYKTKGLNDIIPISLNQDEHLLSIASITNSSGAIIKNDQLRKPKDFNETYSLISGGVERFDPRETHEQAIYLADQFKLEGKRIIHGDSGINEDLKKLALLASSIHKRLEKQGSTENDKKYYILINQTSKKNELLFIDLWITNALWGNNIRPGTKLLSVREYEVKNEDLTLLSITRSGRSALSGNTKLSAFRAALGGNTQQIITITDIKNFFYQQLDNKLIDIEVKKGVACLEDTNSGLVQTIDIFLSISEVEFSDHENLLKELKRKLIIRSSPNIHYQLFIN